MSQGAGNNTAGRGVEWVMSLNAEYEPSPSKWVRDQVREYEGSGGTAGTTMRDMPVVIVTTLGAKSGKVRKVPLMRVEHDGEYAAVASMGGAPKNPVWYSNLVANPQVEVRDGTLVQAMTAREVTGEEKAIWWKRCVVAFPDYADYQVKTERPIPVFVLTANPG
jgi:F420H(2)-dependent quinone reductase